LNDFFLDLLDGRGKNESLTIDFMVKGFIGNKYVADSSTVSFLKERNGWFCFIFSIADKASVAKSTISSHCQKSSSSHSFLLAFLTY
jgi:hypothetical protein